MKISHDQYGKPRIGFKEDSGHLTLTLFDEQDRKHLFDIESRVEGLLFLIFLAIDEANQI